MIKILNVPFEILGDGDTVQTFDLMIGLDYIPEEPEFIPPYERPDLYDPGTAADWGIISLAVNGEPQRFPCFWSELATKWLEANIDNIHHYEV